MYCDICDYTNHNTCDCYRLKPLIKKYKEIIKWNVKCKLHISVNDGDDDDDDGEGYHYIRVVNTNESYNDKKYDPYHAILDNGANITIIKDVQLVTNIRRTKHKHDVITMRGVAQYKWEADSIFETVLYDPTVPLWRNSTSKPKWCDSS